MTIISWLIRLHQLSSAYFFLAVVFNPLLKLLQLTNLFDSYQSFFSPSQQSKCLLSFLQSSFDRSYLTFLNLRQSNRQLLIKKTGQRKIIYRKAKLTIEATLRFQTFLKTWATIARGRNFSESPPIKIFEKFFWSHQNNEERDGLRIFGFFDQTFESFELFGSEENLSNQRPCSQSHIDL